MNALKRLTMMASLLTGILLTLSLSYGSQAATAVSHHSAAPLQIVLNHLEQNRAQYGLVAADLSDYVLTDKYQSTDTGVTHLYLRQRINGIEVWTGNLSAHVLPDGSILALHSAFVPHVDRASYTGQPVLTAVEALNTAAQELRWPVTSDFAAEQQLGGADQRQILSTGGVAVNPIPTKLVYVLDDHGALILAWEAIVQPIHTSDWWHMAIDATTGQVLEQYNWTVSHDERLSFMEQRGGGAEEQRGRVARLTLEPSHSPLAGSYRVFPLPYESPTAPGATHTLVSDPDDSTASPFGWHDTNGVIGAELTTTEGNNVHTYTDTNGDNNPDPGSSPDGGAGLLFDFAFDPSLPPPSGTNPQAAVVNLFYWTNVAHDILYRHGFTEASGNYQTNNYGNGGLGNDSLRAEAQDGSGTNGGNFTTPPDGAQPRMQMFRWTLTTPHRDGAFDAGIVVHEYGHGWSNRLTGGPSNVSCLQNSEQMGEGWSDYLTIVALPKSPTRARQTAPSAPICWDNPRQARAFGPIPTPPTWP
ncbi:MAG: M36 family metallopeptidase [Chloroflexi bacterium]|nr:M36 family metallopeptidase [Chloroflexota bacterium]